MKHIDVTVPFDARLATDPNRTSLSLEPIKPPSRGDSSNVSTLHMSAHTGTNVDAPCITYRSGASITVVEGLNLCDVEPGLYDMMCLPLRLLGSDGAPARVVSSRA